MPVLVRDPVGKARIAGVGTVVMIECCAGVAWQCHVDLGPNLTAHVPPDWLHELPSAGNVVRLWPQELRS